MEFDPAASFEHNLARFRAEVERLDPAFARILFDNLATLTRDSDAARNRQAIEQFNQALLAAIAALP